MSHYTDQLESQIYNISPDDENYTERLIEIAASFRSFGKALDEFILSHGYNGDIKSTDSKIAFIKEKFASANIEPPRSLSKFYTENFDIKKITAFKICFAFKLDVKQTNDFFRRICLKRSFDCHNIEEAIYYYAFLNNLSYSDTQKIIDKAPKADQTEFDGQGEVLYTSTIANEIDRFKNVDELLKYFEDNIGQFGYNFASANKNITAIWNKITGENGLAAREKRELLPESEDCSDKEKGSLWEIYLQILGIDRKSAAKLNSDRSLKPILKDNELLHKLAADSFPDRDGLTKMINGKQVSPERMRKALILLAFYAFWVTLALERRDGTYAAKGGDADRCQSKINHLLTDSGYEELYAGNPYDWIFMYALNDSFPLSTFREFMLELDLNKIEQKS